MKLTCLNFAIALSLFSVSASAQLLPAESRLAAKTTTADHMTSAVDLQAPIAAHLPGGNAAHKIHIWDTGNGDQLVPLDSWAVSTFAGGTNPQGAFYNAVQSGGGYGGSSAHIGNGEVGLFLNGFSTTFKQNQFYWSMSFGDEPRNGTTMPWSGTNDFHYGYKQEFKTVYMPGDVCGYTYLGMFLQDLTTGKVVNFLVADWDSRAGLSQSDFADIATIQNADGSLGSVLPYISAPLGGSALVESYGVARNTGILNGQTFQRYGTITQQNMRNAIALFKGLANRAPQYDNLAAQELQQHGNTAQYRLYVGIAAQLREFPYMSNNPSDYKLISFGLQAELANTSSVWRAYGNGQFGVTYKDVVFTTWTN